MSIEDVNWADFQGPSPDYFTPFDLPYPVAPPDSWANGGNAEWPAGSGPDTGSIVVAGSDDLRHYDPATDILVFGFREADGSVGEMNAHNYCVLWEKASDGTWTLNVMPVSRYNSTEPVATLEGIDAADLPTLMTSWAPTNNHFQDDLTASAYAIAAADKLPANHIAALTHEAGTTTSYDFAALAAEHGDALVLNFVTFTGRELDAAYDTATQTLTIGHYGEGWGGYNDVWGKTVIENVTIEDLVGLEQLWRYDATFEDGRLLNDRFNSFLRAEADAAGVDTGDIDLPGDGSDSGHDHGDHDHGDHDHGDGDTGGETGNGTGGQDGGHSGGGVDAGTLNALSTTVTSEWGTGFVAELVLAADEAVDGWQIDVQVDGEIVNIWNAEIVSQDGDTYVLGAVDYNEALDAGREITIGFQATGSSDSFHVLEADDSADDGDQDSSGETGDTDHSDTGDSDTGDSDPGDNDSSNNDSSDDGAGNGGTSNEGEDIGGPLLAGDFILTNDWGSGAQVALTLTNESDQVIENWSVSLDVPFEIADLWGADMGADSEGGVHLSALSWNTSLAPGQSTDIGFVTHDSAGIDMATWIAEADIVIG